MSKFLKANLIGHCEIAILNSTADNLQEYRQENQNRKRQSPGWTTPIRSSICCKLRTLILAIGPEEQTYRTRYASGFLAFLPQALSLSSWGQIQRSRAQINVLKRHSS